MNCPRCAAELPPDSPEGLCAACLWGEAAAAAGISDSEAPTVLSENREIDSSAGDRVRLVPGQTFGPYLVDRLLGQGGMGEVYEAEHLEHGRRVALKVLNQRLAGAEDRERFLREGQLAASISHPHTVYIFGSEEIGGAPVITMELVAGGTLKDRLDREGALPPAAAVDAILDVIAGLDAAAAGGILHRDVKPSNCFVDPDGRVKVGDFGLSISTLARDVAEGGAGSFQGTPHYAAPEQLKGQPLDIGADIYAVGATLYCLLTGRPPFDDRDLMTLVSRVTTEAPVSPRAGRRAISRGLAAIVLRCLAKDRAGRPASYAALEDALRPFSSTAPTPATLGLRFVAGAIDNLLLAAMVVPLTLSPVLKLDQPATLSFAVNYAGADSSDATWFVKIAILAITWLYYVLLEGLGGASPGKRLCGLRVTRESRPPGLARAAVRTAVFMAPMLFAVYVPKWAPRPAGPLDARSALLIVASMALGGAIAWIGFVSIRRRNGYAALHDLASGTRVVLQRFTEGRAPLAARTEAAPAPASAGSPARRVGPFEVIGTLGTAGAGELLAGFDPLLQRRVWLHMLPAGAPPLAPERRDVGRPGRVRWLTGRRAAGEAWDAYEAPDGGALVDTRQAQPWHTVRRWLADLDGELQAAALDRTTPTLSVDRVWITRASRALLLEFPAPPRRDAAAAAASLPPQRFLSAVAMFALDQDPIPLSARETLNALDRGAVPEAHLTRRLTTIAHGPARVTSWRRATSIALTNVPVIFVAIALLAILPEALRVVRQDFLLPTNCLIEINKLESKSGDDASELRRALETYCAARYAATYADERFWADGRARNIVEPLRPLAVRVFAGHPSVPPDEAAAAEKITRETLGEQGTQRAAATGIAIALSLPLAALGVCAALSLVSALLVRGGVMPRLLGLAVVNRRGTRVSRVRGLWRALVAWSPIGLFWTYYFISRLLSRSFENTMLTIWVVAPLVAVALVGAAWAIAHPSRGSHDRIAGTWMVPR